MTSTTLLHVDPANAGQQLAWDGPEGAYWAAHAAAFERAPAAYDRAFWTVAGPCPGDAVLDVGCGTGSTTREGARRARPGTATGIDLSAAQLSVARAAASRDGLGNAHFVQGDAQVHPFPAGRFDLVVSRLGAMFFADPAAAFANLARATRPGGRLVLLVWQALEHNPWLLACRSALAAGRQLPLPPDGTPGPFSLSDPRRIRTLLTGAGFTGVGVIGVCEQVHLGPDPDAAYALVAGALHGLVADLDPQARARALADLHATMVAHHTPRGVELDSAAWLVTALRTGTPRRPTSL